MNTKTLWVAALVVLLLLLAPGRSQTSRGGKPLEVAVIKTHYSGLPSIWHAHDFGLELGEGPEIIERGGLLGLLRDLGCTVHSESVELTLEEQREFGVRYRLGLANAHLARQVAANVRKGVFTIGLQANDPSALGILAGLQHTGPSRRPLRVGVVWIDAHADFNTPETSRSGMLGGMPVAIAAGLCLTRLRLLSGLEPALPTRYIVLAGVQDVDPLEQELLDRSNMERISVEDIKNLSNNIEHQMTRLSRLTDIIYIHVDLVDVVDQKDHPALAMPFPEGPTSHQLAAALKVMFRYKKTAVLGIASYPAGQDPDGMFLKAAYNLITAAVEAVRAR